MHETARGLGCDPRPEIMTSVGKFKKNVTMNENKEQGEEEEEKITATVLTLSLEMRNVSNIVKQSPVDHYDYVRVAAAVRARFSFHTVRVTLRNGMSLMVSGNEFRCFQGSK